MRQCHQIFRAHPNVLASSVTLELHVMIATNEQMALTILILMLYVPIPMKATHALAMKAS